MSASNLNVQASDWMQNSLPKWGNRPLRRLTLPGSHDAGMYLQNIDRLQVSASASLRIDPPWPLPDIHYDASIDHDTVGSIAEQVAMGISAAVGGVAAALVDKLLGGYGRHQISSALLGLVEPLSNRLAVTQGMPIFEQLSQGVRYFDLRFKRVDAAWYVHHTQDLSDVGQKWQDLKLAISSVSATGASLDDVLDQIARYLQSHRELVVLDFSHFRTLNTHAQRFDEFNVGHYREFADKVHTRLGPWLFEALPQGTRLADVTLNEFISEQSRAIVVVDGDWATMSPVPGIRATSEWRLLGNYSNTAKLGAMKDGQFEEMRRLSAQYGSDPAACEGFAMYWTLTVQDYKSQSVRDLAGLANAAFGSAMVELARLEGVRPPNVVLLDFVSDVSGLVDVVSAMNERG